MEVDNPVYQETSLSGHHCPLPRLHGFCGVGKSQTKRLGIQEIELQQKGSGRLGGPSSGSIDQNGSNFLQTIWHISWVYTYISKYHSEYPIQTQWLMMVRSQAIL